MIHPSSDAASIAELQSMMDARHVSAQDLVEFYIERIGRLDWDGPCIRSVIEVNPDARSIATALDEERRARGPRGPLHGIPVLLKDNVDTADRMRSAAGSLALEGSHPVRDAFVAWRLREAGAVLLGKTNLSEWANFRSTSSTSGWSARGGQCRNPYALDRSPSGSSSGSAAAVAAGFAPASVGTETDGSILSPAAACGVVGIKPTVGRTSRAGVVPIAHSQDTVGTFGRSVADAAALLAAIAGVDAHDPATGAGVGRAGPIHPGALHADALGGARIGVAREVYFSYSPKAARVAEGAIETMRRLGATIVDPANIPTAHAIDQAETEIEVLLYEFKSDLNAYLADRGPEAHVHTLPELIDFNQRHADRELLHFGQELLEMAEARGTLSDPAYLEALQTNQRLSREQGIDAVMDEHGLDALVMPTGSPAIKIDLVNGDRGYGGSSQPAALAGYPAVSVPAGYVAGLPVGITFMGRAWSESMLLALAFAFEQATRVWRSPTFIPTT